MYILYLKNHYSETFSILKILTVKSHGELLNMVRDAITCSSINAAVSTIRLRACLSSKRAA